MKVVSNKHVSHSFHINEGVRQRSILGRTLLLVFINYLTDVISFNLVTYVDDTITYICLRRKSERSDQVKLLTDLEKHRQSMFN